MVLIEQFVNCIFDVIVVLFFNICSLRETKFLYVAFSYFRSGCYNKHFASKNQLPGLSISGTLVEICLILEAKFGNDPQPDPYMDDLFQSCASHGQLVYQQRLLNPDLLDLLLHYWLYLQSPNLWQPILVKIIKSIIFI